MSQDPQDMIVGPRRMTREGLGSALRGAADEAARPPRVALGTVMAAALIVSLLGVFAAATLAIMWRVFLIVSGVQ